MELWLQNNQLKRLDQAVYKSPLNNIETTSRSINIEGSKFIPTCT